MEKLDTSRGAPPLYLQISTKLREDIIKKKYPYQSIIPSEAELQRTYEVSRITARQAIQELEKDGLVERARGKGTVVVYQKKIEETLAAIKSFTQEMRERGMEPGTSYAHIEVVKADKKLGELFGVEKSSPLFRIERVRTGDGEPIVLFVSYFAMSRNLSLEDKDYQGSLYDLLQEKGLEPVVIQEKFDCMMPDTMMKKRLEIPGSVPVLRRVRVSYDRNGEVLEYTLSYYRGDIYTYYVEIRK